MIIDYAEYRDQLSDKKNYDFAIAGAGFAGIILALKLSRKRFKVLLIESGGLEYSPEVQQLYQGEILGNPYFNLAVTRLRYFGGSSNHWGGMCHPLSEFDLSDKSYIPQSGWPIKWEELYPYLKEAADIVDIPGDFSNIGDSIFPKNTFNDFEQIKFNFSEPTRMGQKYSEELNTSEFVDVVTNCTVTDILLEADLTSVKSFTCVSSTKTVKEPFNATSKKFVLALGGLENPRLLLSSSSQIPTGIGNQRDLVGRYFMEHPTFTLGAIHPTNDLNIFWNLNLKTKLEYLICKSKTATDIVRSYRGWLACLDDEFWRPKPEFVTENQIMNCGIRFTKVFNDKNKSVLINLRASAEQFPNPNSRVRLVDEPDALGMRKIGLDWKLTAEDKRTMQICAYQLGKDFALSDTARIKLNEWLLDDSPHFPGLGEDELAGHHHMGTTRMAASPLEGVVDKNALVFGTSNLFVCGSSVFPTTGFVNPTFTICQLSLRLADYLSKITH